ncbi:hypothetical protein C0Q70_15566 [Pomacea canaliculata]|uniref:Uncharacterized protein n=1 Tax=Pomacea canaliculata TaxID=400727 RepID=A0A2T7NV62_POMCA|nr:hypothetical protein C0Q70_15566 [Pomacea canaliculata]
MVPVHRAIPGMGLNPRITVGFMFETEGLPRHWIGTGLPPEVSSFPTYLTGFNEVICLSKCSPNRSQEAYIHSPSF